MEEVLAEHVANEERLVGALSATDRNRLAALLERLAVSLGDSPGRTGARARR